MKGEKVISENGNGARTFGIGFALGMATGAIIALLYAPQPGYRTREQVKEKVGEAVEKVKEKVGHIRHDEEESA
jgi:gas vesicle protein